MISVLFQQDKPEGVALKNKSLRPALPLCWQVAKAKKGHFPPEQHRQILAQAKRLVAPGRVVTFLGDGEFDGCDLLVDMTAVGWHYVCRMAKGVVLAEADWPDETFALSQLMADGSLQPGDCIELTDIRFTAKGLVPVLVGAIWERG